MASADDRPSGILHSKLSPLPTPTSTARQVYFSLRGAILSGILPPDARLTEREIAAQLGISRTPVREALWVLEAEGLAVSTRGRGMAVRRVTAEEVNETY